MTNTKPGSRNPAANPRVTDTTDLGETELRGPDNGIAIGASVALGVLVLGAGGLYVVKVRRG